MPSDPRVTSLVDDSEYFRYEQVEFASIFLQNLSMFSFLNPLKVIIAGHSLGGTSAVALANRLQTNKHVELSGLYLFDAVGHSSTSIPPNGFPFYIPSDTQPDNPEIIPSNTKNIGMVFKDICILASKIFMVFLKS